MKSFRFQLQRVLDWRALLMRREEEKLSVLQANLAALIHRENELMAAQLKSELALLGQESIPGSDLQALAMFQVRIRAEREKLKASKKKLEAQIAEQRIRLLKARKDVRVLEKLKERRWETWSYETNRELENLAAENYNSKWVQSSMEQS